MVAIVNAAVLPPGTRCCLSWKHRGFGALEPAVGPTGQGLQPVSGEESGKR